MKCGNVKLEVTSIKDRIAISETADHRQAHDQKSINYWKTVRLQKIRIRGPHCCMLAGAGFLVPKSVSYKSFA